MFARLILVPALAATAALLLGACGGNSGDESGAEAVVDTASIQEGLESAGYGVFEGDGVMSYETSKGTLTSMSSLDVTEAEKADANLAVIYEFASEEEAELAADAAVAEGSSPEVVGAFLVLAEESERDQVVEAAGG